MTDFRCHLGFSAAALISLAAALLPGQERVLTGGKLTHFDATFSPDGRWVAYQAKGGLFVQSAGGGGETKVFPAGQPVTYLWEGNSASFVVFSLDQLFQAARDGKTRRKVADLSGKGIQDFFFIGPAASFVYGVRRSGRKTIVTRVRLADGRLTDLITTVPGVTSLDLDRSGKKMLISATVFLFTYNFLMADLDGSNLLVINGKALSTLAEHGRWLVGTKTLMFEHIGQVGALGSGFQLWTMDTATGNHRPITWLPRQRKGVPALSPDGKWIAVLEHRPGTGTARALVLPSEGGGEAVLSVPLFQTGDRIRWAPGGQSVVYVGATGRRKLPDVRIYDLDRLLRLSPTARPGGKGLVTLALKRNEAGIVFLGFGLTTPGLAVPGLKGTFDLDPAKGVLPLYAGSFKNVNGPWVTPNDTALVGKEVFLQAVRLLVGQGLKGAFLPVSRVAIAPN